MFDKETEEKLIKIYKHAGIMEFIPPNQANKNKPMKCWYCHHRPCTCKK